MLSKELAMKMHFNQSKMKRNEIFGQPVKS